MLYCEHSRRYPVTSITTEPVFQQEQAAQEICNVMQFESFRKPDIAGIGATARGYLLTALKSPQ